MAFAIIFETDTRIVKKVQAGVKDASDVALLENESVIIQASPGTIPQHAKVDDQGNIVRYEPQKTDAEIKAENIEKIEKAIQATLDKEARAKGYDSILSACSYAGYTNPFQAEGQAFIQWRGSVWKYCYDQLAEIEAGNRSEPTLDEFLGELPAYVPPQA
ncbi:hypothetical protein [Hydrogenimonas sp.]